MANESELYDVVWGRTRLYCSSLHTDNSRRQVIHELADGDDHPIQDQGLGPRKVDVDLLFVEMPREKKTAVERFVDFKRQVDGGESLILRHPFDGDLYVNVEAFNYTIDEDGNIEASATFIKSGAPESPIPAGSATDSTAGADAVDANAGILDAELFSAGISNDVGDKAKAATERWSDADEVPTRQVINDVAELSEQISNMIVDEGLEDDIKLFGAYRAAIMMGDAIRSSALAALAETPRVTAVLIQTPISVLALCVRLYGGAEAIDRERQIRALNDLHTPGWILAGTILVVPVPSSRRR